jgi:hypothetical protein
MPLPLSAHTLRQVRGGKSNADQEEEGEEEGEPG